MPGFFDTTVSQAGVAWRMSTRYPRTVLVREHDAVTPDVVQVRMRLPPVLVPASPSLAMPNRAAMKPLSLAIALMAAGVLNMGAQSQPPSDEQGVRATIARFYEGWNEHNADKMVSAYAEDIDHIDVFGEWQKVRETVGKNWRAYTRDRSRPARRHYRS